MKVLVADDNVNNRQLIGDILEAMDLEAIMAVDGPETVAKAHSSAPDLIILDVNMPGMSGFEVCNTLKTDPLTAPIPILMLTALDDDENRVRGLVVGADDYLTKPFNTRELMERVRTRLRTKVATDDLRNTQQMIRQTFEHFVPAPVVEHLLQNSHQISLGGQLQEISVLFTDLENFTSLSERTEPDKLLSVLNQYHTLVVSKLRENSGTIDKFMGDGVMALFNTPLAQTDHAERAVRTALAIREALDEFHQQFEADYQMRINMGIHTGMAVVGNIGAPDIMDFTAVGDAVNIGARLQQNARKGQILISQATYELVQHVVHADPIGSLAVKGRIGAIQAYQVVRLF